MHIKLETDITNFPQAGSKRNKIRLSKRKTNYLTLTPEKRTSSALFTTLFKKPPNISFVFFLRTLSCKRAQENFKVIPMGKGVTILTLAML